MAGAVAWAYDNELRASTETVTGTPTIAFAYDSDNLLTAAGGLAIVRNAQNGVPQTTTVGTLSDEWTFSSFGELAGYSATASGAPLYAETLTRDTAGRITQKQETIGGSNDTYVYAYDVLGQLTQVTRNGVASESYVYDANGNRTSATSGGTTATATYDNQDRLLTFGPAAYTYSPSGNLATRSAPSGNSSYSYDARGNLVGATLPGGIAVTYLLDGLDRRLGKRVNGTATMQFLDSGMQVVAQLDGGGAVVSRFVYGDGPVPAYLIKGGATYRLVTDSLGSVRLVVDSATGTIAQRIDYDAFGAVMGRITNPGSSRSDSPAGSTIPTPAGPLRGPRLRRRGGPVDRQGPDRLLRQRHQSLSLRPQRPGQPGRPLGLAHVRGSIGHRCRIFRNGYRPGDGRRQPACGAAGFRREVPE